jgi:hypothetical protein
VYHNSSLSRPVKLIEQPVGIIAWIPVRLEEKEGHDDFMLRILYRFQKRIKIIPILQKDHVMVPLSISRCGMYP